MNSQGYFIAAPSSGGANSALTGLSHNWEFQDGSGTDVADSAGSADGLVTGMSWETSNELFGDSCGSFDGSDDEVGVGSLSVLDGSSDFSIEVWFYIDSTGGIERAFSFDNGGASPLFQIGIDTSGTTFLFVYLSDDSDEVLSIAGSDLSNSTWYQVILTYDASAKQIEAFLNNVSEGTDTNNSFNNSGFTVPSARIGSRPSGQSWSFWGGDIQAVRVWNKILSEAERTTLYNSGSGLLITDLPAGEGTPTSIIGGF